MILLRLSVVVLAVVLWLPGCSFDEDAFWPSLTGDDPAGDDRAGAPPPPQTAAATLPPPGTAASTPGGGAQSPAGPVATGTTFGGPPPLGTGSFEPEGVTPGSPTGTFVGKKVVELRDELSRLQDSISMHNRELQTLRAKVVQDSQRFHGTLAAINARLQVGTTPGNPILVQQYNSSLADLDRMAADIAELNKLATSVTGDSTMSAFLSESTRAAFQVAGAVDEDHRQLAILQDEVDRTVVLIERLLQELTEDIRRQTNYVATERSNLNLLSSGIKTGEIYGASLINQAMVSAGGLPAGLPSRGGVVSTAGRRPLVVIRFDRQNVPYQQALYNAVSQVLDRRPNATFDLVAVAPGAGGAARVALNTNRARRNAEGVLRSLIEMGLPPTRVALSAQTNLQARANEVHLYVR